MFLTRDELFELTGYRIASKQVKQLKAQRIPFYVNRAGHPKVAKAIIEGQRGAPAQPTPKPTWIPSWAGAQA